MGHHTMDPRIATDTYIMGGPRWLMQPWLQKHCCILLYHILLKPLILRFHGSKESFSVMWILRTSALVHKILSGSSVKDEFLGRGLQCLQLQHDMKDLLVLILHNLDSCTETGYLEPYIRRRKSENLWSSGHWDSKKNQKRLQAAPSVTGFMQFHWLETQVFTNGRNFGDAIAKVQPRCWSSACLSCFF